jgi:hypothetical protein
LFWMSSSATSARAAGLASRLIRSSIQEGKRPESTVLSRYGQ